MNVKLTQTDMGIMINSLHRLAPDLTIDARRKLDDVILSLLDILEGMPARKAVPVCLKPEMKRFVFMSLNDWRNELIRNGEWNQADAVSEVMQLLA